MNFLTKKYGPLPGWAWGLIVAGAAYFYLSYRKKQAAAAAAAAQANSQGVSSNLGNVPVSNLTTAAQPMPIQLGDTFVTTPPVTVNSTTSVPITNNPPPSSTLQPPQTPAPPPAPTIPGYGIVSTVQGLMDWLGVNTSGAQIYNVGGGAPVYFGNASNLSQGLPTTTGQDIYTPVGYSNQVASQTATLQSAYKA